jgi:hypothetical protein
MYTTEVNGLAWLAMLRARNGTLVAVAGADAVSHEIRGQGSVGSKQREGRVASGKTRSEEWVNRICTRSFFDLWSYANPSQGGKHNKELCDALVVCHPDIVVFSVKEVDFDATGDVAVKWERWARRAVKESGKQLHGAGRWLEKADRVIRADGTRGVLIPKAPERRIHKIAVALGGRGEVPIAIEGDERGHLHVFTEEALDRVMGELDTIEDLVQYLDAKEQAFEHGSKFMIYGGESDLLALYLSNNRQLSLDADVITITDDLWQSFSARPEYLARKREEEKSRIWDAIVRELSADTAKERMLGGGTLDEGELAIRAMARENRFNRRMLGESFAAFLDGAAKGELAARLAPSPSGVTYVFLAMPLGTTREVRTKTLLLRCAVARGIVRQNKVVVGIATEKPSRVKGHSLDICYLEKPDWTAADEEEAETIKRDFGYFVNARTFSKPVDEYPGPGHRSAGPKGNSRTSAPTQRKRKK